MNIRAILAAFLVALCLTIPASAGERVIHIREGATTDPAAGVFATLDDLRQALEADPPEIYLDSGTVILLHNDDSSLRDEGLILPAGVDITLRSTNGSTIYSRTAEPAPIGMVGDNPSLRIENIHFAAGKGAYAVEALAVVNTTDTEYAKTAATTGTLSVSGSTFSTGDGATTILLGGHMDATFTNSLVHNDNTAGILHAQGHLSLNIVFDNNASSRTIWTGDWSLGGTFAGAGNYDLADVNVSVAGGKYFEVQGDLYGNIDRIAKTGGGVWKIRSGVANSVDIQGGTVHFSDKRHVPVYEVDANGNPVLDADGNYTIVDVITWAGDNINVGRNGVFKPTIDAGNLEASLDGTDDVWERSYSEFILGSFTTEHGARLEVGGISTLPQFNTIDEGRTSTTITTVEVIYRMIWADRVYDIAPTMAIDNRLMKASLKPGDLTATTFSGVLNADPDNYNGYVLHIERLNNLATLDGVGSFADIYRKMDLSDVERDMLDGIYNRGGAGSDIGFLQTIGGYQVQDTLVAMRHHQANMLHKINQRVTGYQKEDLYDLSINGGEVCNYSDWDACTDSSEMWAYIDQTWMSQNDVDSIAGYRYQAHTLGLGYDWHTGSWIYGGVLNYSAGKLKLRNNYGAYTDIDSLLGSVYASWAQGGYYLTGVGMVGYGWNDSTSTYAMPELKTVAKTGNYATSMAGLSVEGGYMWETEFRGLPLRITPYGGLTYARLHRNAVRETGAEFEGTTLNRQFRSADWDMWEYVVGARWAMPLERERYTLIPSVDVAVTRTMGSLDTAGGDAFFVDRDSSGWKIPVMASNRTSVRMAANLDAKIRQNLTMGAGYEFEWRHRYWKHQLSLGMTLGF